MQVSVCMGPLGIRHWYPAYFLSKGFLIVLFVQLSTILPRKEEVQAGHLFEPFAIKSARVEMCSRTKRNNELSQQYVCDV